MNYLAFLQWIIANAGKFQEALELLKKLIGLFTPADIGTLGITQALTADDAECGIEVNAEIELAEAQAIEAIAALGPTDVQQAFDGSRLRKLFETLGPLLPLLIKLFGLG